jgi:hypothetical protein
MGRDDQDVGARRSDDAQAGKREKTGGEGGRRAGWQARARLRMQRGHLGAPCALRAEQ